MLVQEQVIDILYGNVGRLRRRVAMEECHLLYLRDARCASNLDVYIAQRHKMTNAKEMMLDVEYNHHRARLQLDGLKRDVDEYEERIWISDLMTQLRQ